MLLPSPEEVKAQVAQLHAAAQPIIDDELDNLLGLSFASQERELYEDLRERQNNEYDGELVWPVNGQDYVWTRYDAIRALTRALQLRSDDVLYDLGAGYGRLPVYAGITSPAQTRGIELVPERVEIARRAIDRLKLPNVEIIQTNVLDHDFSDGTVFYMYSPFSTATRDEVTRRLGDVAEYSEQQIRIANKGEPYLFERQDWLELVDKVEIPATQRHTKSWISIYESRS